MSDNSRMSYLIARERAREVERNARHSWRRTTSSRRKRPGAMRSG